MDGVTPHTLPNGARAPAEKAALPSRIVVGVDEGPASADALALATSLAAVADAELIVASVRAYWPESNSPGDHRQAIAEEEAELRRLVTPQLEGRQFRTRVIAGGAGKGLQEIAESEGADLIVVSSTHRGPVGRVLPGSVGERVLDGAPCAVAIAPRGQAERERRLRRVVVGCDGSRESTAALGLAAAVASVEGSGLTLVGVAEMRFDLAGFPRPADPGEIARVERALARARAALPADLEVRTAEVHGVAADVIAAIAQDADLLVIGSRVSYGPVRRLFLGSVAAKVARTAPCATVIVPAA